MFFDRLAEIAQANPKLQGGQIARTKKQLLSAEADLASLDKFADYWHTADWRGQKGQSPSLTQIVSEWGKAMAWNPNAIPANSWPKTQAEPKSRLGKGMNW